MERIFDMPNEDYHSAPAYSQSQLKKILKSLAHFKHSTFKETPAIRTGRIIHDALLTPGEFKKNYVVDIKVDKRTKAGKEEYEIFQESVAQNNQTILSDTDYDLILGMIDAVQSHPIAKNVLSLTEKEVSFFVEFDEFPGIKLKARPDLIDGPAIFDLKTTQDASMQSFSKSIVNYGYDFQAAFYIDVVNRYYEVMGINERVKDFIFWPIEKDVPYSMAFYVADVDVIERGRSLYMKTLQDLSAQLEKLKANPNAEWPGYPVEINPIYLTSWA